MADGPRPLNGTKTHPLKASSILALRLLSKGPLSAHLLNPGVRDRLSREGLAEAFFSLGGHSWRITEAGLKRLREIDND